MPNQTEVRVVITADPSGAIRGLRMVGDETENQGRRGTSALAALRSHWLALTAAAASAYLVISRGMRVIEQSIEAANAQADAEAKLTQALGYRSHALLDQASAIQARTRYEDDAVVTAQAQIAMFVREEQQIKRATEATLDLAAAKGMDLVSAADLVSKSLGSSTNALERYGVHVEGAAGSTERLESLVTNVSRVFGGQAAAAATTYAGRVIMLKNAWGDAKEELGSAVTQNQFMIETAGLLKGAIEDLTDWIKTHKAELMELTKGAVLFAADTFILLAESINKVAGAWRWWQEVLAASKRRPGLSGAEANAAAEQEVAAVRKANEEKQKSWDALLARVRKLREDIAKVEAAEVAAAAGTGKRGPLAPLEDPEAHAKILADVLKQEQAAALAREEMALRVGQAEEMARIEGERARLKAHAEELKRRHELGYLSRTEAIREEAAMKVREAQLMREELLTRAVAANEAERVTLAAEYGRLGEEILRIQEREAEDVGRRRLELQREITELTRQQAESYRQFQMEQAQGFLGRLGGGELGQLAGFDTVGTGQGTDPYSLEYERWAALQDQRIMAMEEYGAAEAQIKEAYRQYDLMQERMAQQQKVALAGAAFGAMSALMQGFYAAAGQRNKGFFQLYKGFAIAQAIVDTYGAFNAALKGPPGPPWSFPIAAMTLGLGMAKVQQIASMQPGGSASAGGGAGWGGSFPSVGGGGTPRVPEAPPSPPAAPQVNLNIHLYGDGIFDEAALDKFARQLAAPLQKAYEDNVGR